MPASPTMTVQPRTGGLYWCEPLEFELPRAPFGKWRRWIDTSLPSPEDIVEMEEAPEVDGASYRAAARSVVLLFSRRG